MDRLLSLLLTELDGVMQWNGPPLILLGATRARSLLDPAILRPGRLDVHIRVDSPDGPQRERLLEEMLARTPVQWTPRSDAEDGEAEVVEAAGGAARAERGLAWLAARSDGYSLAQLSALCREAAMSALREDLDAPAVRTRHFEQAAAAVAMA